jgi:hypothetical protein
MSDNTGVSIVLTAPLTECIDHAGFFIQMSLASIPEWMEWAIDKKDPAWHTESFVVSLSLSFFLVDA